MKPYSPLTPKFWHRYFIQMRPYLLFVSGSAGLTGSAIAYSYNPDNWDAVWMSFIVFFLAYGFGQALTDSFQTDTDKISAPDRPLSKGELSVRAVLITSASGLILSGIVLIALNGWNAILAVLTIFGLASYTYIKKRFWFGGPFYNAWIVMLLPVMGFFCVQGSRSIEGLSIWVLVITFFSYANFVIMGYLKDIEADRATGYRTFPVVFGWKATVWVGDVFVLICFLSFLPFLSAANTWSITFWALAIAIAIIGQLHAHLSKNKIESESIFAIKSTVRTFILLQWSLILMHQPDWLWWAIGFCLLFELTLYLRNERDQV